jgi:hypothetical protein
MRWDEIGCLFTVENIDINAVSHAMIPTPIILKEDVLRIYFTSRDSDGVGRPRYADFDLSENFKPLGLSDSALMDIGRGGTFDDNGVIVCSVIERPDGELYMYYAGFELSTKIRYRIFTGLASSSDGGNHFVRVSEAPVLDRNGNELYFRGGAFVQEHPGGLEMFYVGGSDWIQLENSLKPVYSIRRTLSEDGITWNEPVELISPKFEDEHGFGRPYILELEDKRFLYYSVRDSVTENYRIGFAEFTNQGLIRKDSEFALYKDNQKTKNDDIMYASFFTYKGENFLLFNKSDFGRDGVFIAKLSVKV